MFVYVFVCRRRGSFLVVDDFMVVKFVVDEYEVVVVDVWVVYFYYFYVEGCCYEGVGCCFVLGDYVDVDLGVEFGFGGDGFVGVIWCGWRVKVEDVLFLFWGVVEWGWKVGCEGEGVG